MYYYKFVRWDARPLEEAKQHFVVKAFEAFENGDKTALKDIHTVLDAPSIDCGGWRFDLRPHLKRYWVKIKGYGINEYWAVRKTDIKKHFGRAVIEIIQCPNEEV